MPRQRCVAMGPKDRKRRRRSLIKRDGNKCYWCKKDFTEELPPTFDHLKARKAGGTDRIDNLVLACEPCNNGRTNYPGRPRNAPPEGADRE